MLIIITYTCKPNVHRTIGLLIVEIFKSSLICIALAVSVKVHVIKF